MFPLQGIFLIQGSEPRSLASQMNSLPSEPPEKPENTGVGSLSLLQGIFPNQQSNRGLLHCRQILYQLSHTPFSSLKSLCSLMLPGFSAHQVHTGACPPLGLEDPLEKGMSTHSSILAWRIPWMEGPGRLQSMGSQRVKHN